MSENQQRNNRGTRGLDILCITDSKGRIKCEFLLSMKRGRVPAMRLATAVKWLACCLLGGMLLGSAATLSVILMLVVAAL